MALDSVLLAGIIVTYLQDRDDVALAQVVEDLGGVVSGVIITQGGQRFAFAVEPADD